MSEHRFDRHMALFGKEGQHRLRTATVAVVGVGGLGTHVVQQLSLLGVGQLNLVDAQELDETNLNRYVGARHDDPVPGTRKVDLGERITGEIDPTIRVQKVFDSLASRDGFAAVQAADYVFGCLDNEASRLILTELCAAHAKPYLDLASDISPGETPSYGGRVCVAWNGSACLVCLGALDVQDAQRQLAGPKARQDEDAIYGVHRRLLGRTGPSVVSINGAVASMAITEFMVAATGIRAPLRLINYYGHLGKATVSKDQPQPDCYYCKGIWGRRGEAGVERYVLEKVGERMRGSKTIKTNARRGENMVSIV